MPPKAAPRLTRLAQTPAEFAASQARHLESFTYDNTLLDLEGAREAGQWGLLARVSRNALERGVDAYPRNRGLVNITYLNRFTLFRRAAGRRVALYHQAWALDVANPMSPEEVTAYAAACRQFVEHDLGIRPPGYCYGYNLPENHAVYDELNRQAEALTRHLGMDSPFPVTRLPRYIAGVTDPAGSMTEHSRTTQS